jgi:hypothetical protein
MRCKKPICSHLAKRHAGDFGGPRIGVGDALVLHHDHAFVGMLDHGR